MGRNKRLNYEMNKVLNENHYDQELIRKILETPHGHISKVLRGMGVKTRKRGEVVHPVSYKNLDKRLKNLLKLDYEVFDRYVLVTGFDVKEDKVSKEEWKSLSKKEKVDMIMEKLDEGMTTRESVMELDISQSMLVKIKKILEERMII